MNIDKIAVVGVGYVGLVSAVCFAHSDITVVGVERDAAKVAQLQQGKPIIHEAGLEELLVSSLASGKLRFTTSLRQAIEQDNIRIIMLAVGTPENKETGRADLRALYAVVQEAAAIAEELDIPRLLLVNKSTVPVGTAATLDQDLKQWPGGQRIELASNPEFLREGKAIQDFMLPDRIVLGTNSATAAQELHSLYRSFIKKGVKLCHYRRSTAEMIKHAANGFLAMKITFINEIADLCDKMGADVMEVAEGIGLDGRIGRDFLNPGPGYGGSCFPKDTRELAGLAALEGSPLSLIEATIASNDRRRKSLGERVNHAFGKDLAGTTIGILGLAFKAGTDDVRESPAQELIPWLHQAKARVIAHDPVAEKDAQRNWPSSEIMAYESDIYSLLSKVELVVILTEWPEYAALSPADFVALGTKLVVDFRNLYDPRLMAEAGICYQSLGRPLLIKS